MTKPKAEPVSAIINATMRGRGPEIMGVCAGFTWHDDPRRMAFMLSRYKFVAKMFEGYGRVLEIGCGDGFGTRIVKQTVRAVTAIDFDQTYIDSAVACQSEAWPIEFRVHDVLEEPVSGTFDGVFALDVLEHIPQSDEEKFIANAIAPLSADGACIFGMPSLESQPYASAGAKLGHVNCKEQPVLRSLMSRFFRNVFMFGANDEVVHTGYSKMAHYNIALCCGKK